MGDLAIQRALITGGGSGVGAVMARMLADAGVKVAVSGRRTDVLAEVAQQEFGEHMIEAVQFSKGWYRENTPKFKQAFEDGDIRSIPRDDDVLQDLRSFKQIQGVAQIPSDERTLEKAKRGRKRHGDAGIACLLGHYASERDIPEYDYTAEEDDIEASALADSAFDGSSGRQLW